jgi:DeoR family suf operon transcriptional repressor
MSLSVQPTPKSAAQQGARVEGPTAHDGQPPGDGSAVAATPTNPEGLTSAPTREAVLTLLLRQGKATAADLASQLLVSVQVMRRHLRSLEDDGLVVASPTAEGPGRPSNRWGLTREGRSRFPDGSEHFALGLLSSMAASLPTNTISDLLGQQAAEKAAIYRQNIGSGSLAERIERLVDLRRRDGYVAEFRPDSDGLGWVMSEFHCSVMAIAEQFPQVCDQELQLIRHTFPDCQVDRVHWRLEGGHSCGFRLQRHPAADALPAPGQGQDQTKDQDKTMGQDLGC